MYENLLNNLNIIEKNEALEMLGGEEDLLIELLNSFLNDKKFDLENLKKLEKTNPQEAAGYVHYFKGAARQLCMKRLALTGQTLEDILRCKADGDINELNALFFLEYNKAFDEVKKLF